MGIDLKVNAGTTRTELDLLAAIRRGLLAAGKEVLAVSDILAPREPPPLRHPDIGHLIDTGFVRVLPGANRDTAIVGYTAFWALFQHEHLEWHHPNGGQAKFLETALMRSREAVLEQIGASLREAL